MSSLQEVSNQLMKSVKELANWEYPLSQILEKYYILLENPTAINYGEAALIVQNSVDVYIKRVDFLDKEVFSLSQSIIEHEVQEEKLKKKEKKTRRILFDFDNFEPLDFVKEVGKNINIKNSVQRTVKLLNRRFTQLETSTSQIRFPIEITDIHGEFIGKKYDFRCNQQLTISGMLVDEYMPNDVNQINNNCELDQQMSNRLSCTPEDSLNLSNSSDDVDKQNRNNSKVSVINENSTNCITDNNCISQEDSGYSSILVENHPEQITLRVNDISSQESHEENDTLNSVLQPIFEESADEELEDFHLHLDDYTEDERLSNTCDDSEVGSPVKNIDRTPESNIPENSTNSFSNIEKKCQKIMDSNFSSNERLKNDEIKSKRKIINDDGKDTDSGYTSKESEDYEIPRRRSKRMKNMICVVNDINRSVWKPIPFDQGIPEKLPKSRSKFKLPCHISLLKSKSSSRKRKILTERKRTDSLPKFLLSESESSPIKKMNMYSPSRPFTPLKTEDLLDFQKSFYDCFKNKQCCDTFHYEAATTVTMDLLGFFPSFTKHDPLSTSIPYKTLATTPEHLSASCSDSGFSPQSPPHGIISYDLPDSPDSGGVNESFDIEEPLHSTFNYQQLIECKMKEIYEEFDARTDLEQNVAQWHETIKPKLSEAENKPLFHIREYSKRIIAKLEETNERRMSFERLISNQTDASEVARFFSASLQLANTNNINIQTDNNNTNIELILLDSNCAYEVYQLSESIESTEIRKKTK